MNQLKPIFNDLPKLEDVIADIKRVLDETGMSPLDITVVKYKNAGGLYDCRKLRRLGGFVQIVDYAFRSEAERDFNIDRFIANSRNYTKRLERKLGDLESYRHSLKEDIKQTIDKNQSVVVTKSNKPKLPKKERAERENCALLTDMHFGLSISKEEVLTNEYSWSIAANRLSKFAEVIASFQITHRDECPQLRLCLGGDIGHGIIHWMSDCGTDLITNQAYGASSYIIQMIDYLKNFYSKIVVEFTPDNHMRLTHKGENRATAQKYDSYATIFHCAIQNAFRTFKDVEFHVSKSPISTFNVLGHKMGLTHGDTHINVSNVGSKIDIGSISNQIMGLNQGVDPYKVMMMGHVHTALYMPILSGTPTALVIGGTMSGTDGYASSKGFFVTTPLQVLFEVTKEHPVGVLETVNLSCLDKHNTDIIKPYTGGLEVSKLNGIHQH